MKFEDHAGLLKMLEHSDFSDSLKTIIRSCLTPNPGKRPDARALLSAIKSCITKGDTINNVPCNGIRQMRTLSSPGPLFKLYAQKQLSSNFKNSSSTLKLK